jgi:hypothetical protein
MRGVHGVKCQDYYKVCVYDSTTIHDQQLDPTQIEITSANNHEALSCVRRGDGVTPTNLLDLPSTQCARDTPR